MADRTLWLPPQYQTSTREERIPPPERLEEKRRLAFKWRAAKGQPWYGGSRLLPKELDIDEATVDGMTVRAHLRLYLTGQIERATRGQGEDGEGFFVWQDGDHMQSNLYIEEWPMNEDTQERWDLFIRREP